MLGEYYMNSGSLELLEWQEFQFKLLHIKSTDWEEKEREERMGEGGREKGNEKFSSDKDLKAFS